jgi:hypothetical protein
MKARLTKSGRVVCGNGHCREPFGFVASMGAGRRTSLFLPPGWQPEYQESDAPPAWRYRPRMRQVRLPTGKVRNMITSKRETIQHHNRGFESAQQAYEVWLLPAEIVCPRRSCGMRQWLLPDAMGLEVSPPLLYPCPTRGCPGFPRYLETCARCLQINRLRPLVAQPVPWREIAHLQPQRRYGNMPLTE